VLERREKASSATLLRSFVEQLPPRSNFVHNLLPAKDSQIEGYLCCFRQIGRMDLRDTRAEDALHPRIVVVEVLGELLGYRVRVEDRVHAEPRSGWHYSSSLAPQVAHGHPVALLERASLHRRAPGPVALSLRRPPNVPTQ
jgi:hypothetical protein